MSLTHRLCVFLNALILVTLNGFKDTISVQTRRTKSIASLNSIAIEEFLSALLLICYQLKKKMLKDMSVIVIYNSTKATNLLECLAVPTKMVQVWMGIL